MELLMIAPGEDPAPRIALARALGHKSIVLLYAKHDKRNKAPAGVQSAVLVPTASQAKSLKKDYDLIVAPCARELFESRFVDCILEPESGKRPDFIHHRNSGLNQVLLKLCQATAKRPGKRVITTARLLLETGRPAVVLGRMRQNARWCRKYKVDYVVASGARTAWQQRDKACLDGLKRSL